MINKVIVVCLGRGWCREVDPVCFADRFGVLVRSREADQPGMELGQVRRYPSGSITRWVDRNEHRLNRGSMLLFYSASERAELEGTIHPELTKCSHGSTHLVQLFWADVGAIGKPEINQGPFPQ